MSFFKMLTWDNGHMDLRYLEDKYSGSMEIINVYSDDREVDYTQVNSKYGEKLKSARGTINGNRIGMLILFMILVFLPALLISVIQGNVLLIGSIIVYSIFAYFIVEAVNQVVINRVLYNMDEDLSKER